MSPRICSVDGCAKAVKARGLCPMHDWRWRTHGDVTVCTTNRYNTAEERFWMKVQKTETCWNWTAAKSADGYGRFTERMGGRSYNAHRYAYEQIVGPIPEGKLLDHICHNRACVNPDHLRPVTPKQNRENLRGPSKNSTTGILGVSYNTKERTYVVIVGHYGKSHYAGSFSNLEEAAEAAKRTRLSLFTHNEIDRRSE